MKLEKAKEILEGYLYNIEKFDGKTESEAAATYKIAIEALDEMIKEKKMYQKEVCVFKILKAEYKSSFYYHGSTSEYEWELKLETKTGKIVSKTTWTLDCNQNLENKFITIDRNTNRFSRENFKDWDEAHAYIKDKETV